MKRTFAMFFALIVMLVGQSFAQHVNEIDWQYGKPGVRVVTNAQSRIEAKAGFLAGSNYVDAAIDALTPAGIGGATAAQGGHADTAYGWGNHASAGYLTGYTESDPVAGPRLVKLEGRTNTWNAALQAGATNTATGTIRAGYFVGNGSLMSGIATSAQGGNADTAYGWGNHALAGYLTEYIDTLATVAARGGFSGSETISPGGVSARHGGFSGVTTNVVSIGNVVGGSLVCNPSSGDMTSLSAQYFKVYAYKYVPGDPLERVVFSATAYAPSFLPIGVTKPYSYTLKWGPVSGADGYKIYVPGGSPYFGTKAKFVGSTETNHTFTTATAGFWDSSDPQQQISPFDYVTTNTAAVLDVLGTSSFTGSILLSRISTATANDVLNKAETEALTFESIYAADETQRVDGDGRVWQRSGTLTVTGSGASYNGPTTGSLLYFDILYYEETGEVYYTNTVWSLFMETAPMTRWYLNKYDSPEWGAFISDTFPIPSAALSNNTGFALGTVSLSYSAIGTTWYFADSLAYASRLNQYPTIAYHTAAMAAEEVARTNGIAVAAAASTNTATGGARFGALALGAGDPITEWPTGGAAGASTLTPIVNVATGEVTTVTWSATPRINYIELATQTTITNATTSLGNCLSNVETEVWINATSTNALAPVWDARMIWQDGTPEMTVTGLYKFALSSACGTNIYARQTWPTAQPWLPLIVQRAFGGSATLAFGGNGTLSLGSTAGGNISYYWPSAATTIVVRAETFAAVTAGLPTDGSAFGDWLLTGYNVAVLPAETNRCVITAAGSNKGGPVLTTTRVATRTEASGFAYIRAARIIGEYPASTNCHVWGASYWRQLTPLEVNAGWRP